MTTLDQDTRAEMERVEVSCAFCGGTGRDPFGIMSPLATCQVCGGAGRRRLFQPTHRCAFCRGTGVHPGSRMTCTSCGGVGLVTAPADAVTCPGCGGSGRASDYLWPGSPLSCGLCHGKGFIPLWRTTGFGRTIGVKEAEGTGGGK